MSAYELIGVRQVVSINDRDSINPQGCFRFLIDKFRDK